MPLDVSAVGYETEAYELSYDWRTTVLYALGIGATEQDLDYLYEARGPKVFPTFAVVPAYAALRPLLERAKAPMELVIHGGQSIYLDRPFPPSGRLETKGRIKAMHDLKRLAEIVLETTTLERGEPICRTQMSILVRDSGGFGGERRPKVPAPSVPREKAPDFSTVLETRREQALLYRLSGDENPLHADPAVAAAAGFPQGPILHGLCTFGVLGRAVIASTCGGNGARLRELHAQFKKPVWPGDPLRTLGYYTSDRQVALEMFAGDRPDAVVSAAWAELEAPN
jgi:acyl dehydratase